MPIIDTSVVLTVLLHEPLAVPASAALAASAGDLHAPDILILEIANAAVGAVRCARITADDAVRVPDHALQLPIQLHTSTRLVPRALELSLLYQRRPYDGIYLALAELRREVLLTTDVTLANGMRGTPQERWVRLMSG